MIEMGDKSHILLWQLERHFYFPLMGQDAIAIGDHAQNEFCCLLYFFIVVFKLVKSPVTQKISVLAEGLGATRRKVRRMWRHANVTIF